MRSFFSEPVPRGEAWLFALAVGVLFWTHGWIVGQQMDDSVLRQLRVWMHWGLTP